MHLIVVKPDKWTSHALTDALKIGNCQIESELLDPRSSLLRLQSTKILSYQVNRPPALG